MYRKNRVPMYEGDGYIHSSPKQDNFQNPPVQAARNPGSQVGRRPGLSAAARELLHRLAAWIGHGLQHPQRKAFEDFLSRSSDLADVERRIRQLEREGRPFPG